MDRAMPRLIPELKVRDFEKSLDFYTRLAAFKIFYDRPEEHFAMLEKESSMVMIELLESQDRWAIGKREYPLGQGINFQIEVADIQAMYENLKNNDYPIFFQMEDKWYRKDDSEVGNRQFLVQDPDGYLFRFFQDLGERLKRVD
jgi:catechol 2,3-dioxygenase-like lactoylglutathione lyase family enzyme